MKNLIKTGIYKYIFIALISVLVSGVTILASEKQVEQQISVDENTARLENQITEMTTVLEELQNEIQYMKEYIETLEKAQIQTYIITREAPVFEETSSLSERVGTFPISSLVTVTNISEDGIWLECEQGYFKIYNAIKLTDAKDKETFILAEEEIQEETEEEVVGTQPTEETKTLVNGSKSIVGKSNLTLEQVEQLLAGSPMSGTGQTVLQVEEKYNVNAFFTIAVAQCETQRGLTGTGASKKNPYGLTVSGGGYRAFSSYSEAIETFGSTLSRLYIPNGRTTVEKVNEIYCPDNSNWSTMVRTIMDNYLKKLT